MNLSYVELKYMKILKMN